MIQQLEIKDKVILKNTGGGKLENTTGVILAIWEIGPCLFNCIVLLDNPCDDNLAAIIPNFCLERIEFDGLNINDKIKFQNTGDERLDDECGVIIGRHNNDFIVMFTDTPPNGYNPSFVIGEYCLKKIS